MPDFDVISLLECKKRKVRSHGKRKKRQPYAQNLICAEKNA